MRETLHRPGRNKTHLTGPVMLAVAAQKSVGDALPSWIPPEQQGEFLTAPGQCPDTSRHPPFARPKEKGGTCMSMLNTVRKHFPQVKKVFDAKEGLVVEVTRKDEATSKRRKHSECAMAIAAKRTFHADGVIVSVTKAYLVTGDTATRYQLPEAVSREVVSFDRGAGFAPGQYRLLKPDHPLGRKSAGGKDKSSTGTGKRRTHHVTEGIRTVLGAKDIS
jgi:hypothetical protein